LAILLATRRASSIVRTLAVSALGSGFNLSLSESEGVLDQLSSRGVSLAWDNQRKASCAELRIANDSPKRWETLNSRRPFVALPVIGATQLYTLLIWNNGFIPQS
jgi:hypothetical protein